MPRLSLRLRIFQNIRIFKVEKTLAATPETDLAKFNSWYGRDSNALDSISFSAAAYFFGCVRSARI